MMQNGGIFNDIEHYHLHIFPRYQYDGFGWIFSDIAHDVSTKIAKELKELLTQIK